MGAALSVYHRTFRITACDAFTRSLCEQMGHVQPQDVQPPDDPYLARREVSSEGLFGDR